FRRSRRQRNIAKPAARVPGLQLEVLEARVLPSLMPSLLTDVNGQTGQSFLSDPVQMGSVVYFGAADGIHGMELWRSDGSASGTFIVKDINTTKTAGSYPYDLTNVKGTLFFNADDGVHGKELWRSNGTAAGTQMVLDAAPGEFEPNRLTNVNGMLFFAGNGG